MKDKFPTKNFIEKKLTEENAGLFSGNNVLPIFANKITTPEEAVSCIKPGGRVFVGTGCATPRTLTTALENLNQHLEDVQLYHFLVNGAIPFEDGIPKTKFYHKAFFVDSDMRELIKQGKGDYIPVSIAQVPNLIKNGGLTIDVALIQVTMPDKNGFVSLGVSADITHAVIQKAKIVIAELNPNMPRTLGNTFISMDKIHKAIIVDSPVIEFEHLHEDDRIVKSIARKVDKMLSTDAYEAEILFN